jgi:steroid 5-alpha reductase family enzyme
MDYQGNAMKQKFFINTHKGFTFLAILGMMMYFNQWDNITAWLYLALHGTYGLLWVLKSRVFPDRQWESKTSPAYAVVIWSSLSLYWIAGFIITSRSIQAPGWLLGLCVSMYGVGVFLHFASDMQKYIELKYNPGQLITDGLFRQSRNINYFGELLIYLGFGLLAMHWLPILVILLFITFFWVPNMIKKDMSLARYPQFAEYKRKSKLFFPFLF